MPLSLSFRAKASPQPFTPSSVSTLIKSQFFIYGQFTFSGGGMNHEALYVGDFHISPLGNYKGYMNL